MKAADALIVGWAALTHLMQTDTRFTPDELAALVVIDALLDAGSVTTKEQDMLVVQCMKKYVCQDSNY